MSERQRLYLLAAVAGGTSTAGDAVALAALLQDCAASLSHALTDAVARNVSTPEHVRMAMLHGRLLDMIDQWGVA
jgi:hypothetical protein